MLESFSLADPALQIPSIVVGLIALLLGRKLFWLLVAIAGFLVGLNLALQIFDNQPAWLALLVALLMGVIGAVIAIVLQKVAVAVVGFLLGGYILLWVLSLFVTGVYDWTWLIIFVVGGFIGATFVLAMFDPALILLSSIAGASTIVQALSLDTLVEIVLFVVLVVIGISIQATMMARETAAPPPRQAS
jgi:hypothetical protein